MKLHLFSDIHTEFYKDKGISFFEGVDPEDATVAVLAGDIFANPSCTLVNSIFAILMSKYDHVIYVTGNHEYWRSSPDKVHQSICQGIVDPNRVHFLNNESVTINGQRFLGGTMWFRDVRDDFLETYMPDFSLIQGFKPWVYGQQRGFENLLSGQMTSNDIIVTHHLPSEKSVAPMFKASALNPFFVCDMEELILERQPKLFLHGHAHYPFDYNIGNTRVVCNPRGYPNERNSAYRPKLIEI